MSHSPEKCKRGDPLGFINIYSVAKYQKNSKGDSFETIKFFREIVAQCRKNWNGDPLVSSGFVGYVKTVKNERGDPFVLISADRLGLMVVVLLNSIVRKVAQSEWDCSLAKKKKKEKKLATVRVGHFSLEKRRLKTNEGGLKNENNLEDILLGGNANFTQYQLIRDKIQFCL